MREGFALAAAAHGDRGAALAARALPAGVAELATDVARALASRDADARRQWLRDALLDRHAPLDRSAAGSARALALLAPFVDRELGRRWLRAAPVPRAGYVPHPELLLLVRELASREGTK